MENDQNQNENVINTTADTDFAGDSLENSFAGSTLDEDEEASQSSTLEYAYDPEKQEQLSVTCKPVLFGAGSVCLFCIAIIILAVGAGKGLFSKSSNDNVCGEGIYGDSRLCEYLVTVTADGPSAFGNPISPASQALLWMENDDTLDMDPNDEHQQYRIDQRFALLTLWFQSELDWSDQTNWLSEDECTWNGVVCALISPKTGERGPSWVDGGINVVRSLNLEKNNLQGKLPPDLSLLKYLTSLNLSGNNIFGGIPWTFGSMTALKELYLHNNLLSGEISLDFSRLSNLVDLNLSNNNLKGTIPNSLYSATSITRMQLEQNEFTGGISDKIGDLVNLCKRSLFSLVCRKVGIRKVCTLLSNLFSTAFFLFHYIIDKFTAGDNQLDGTIPGAVGNLKNLDELSLRNNSFVGKIADEFSTLPELRYIDFSFNDLTGIASAFSTIESLEILVLDNNSLSGVLDFAGLRNLDVVMLESNKFSGPLPDFSNSTRIQILRLGDNDFDGQVFPRYMMDMTNLMNLGLNELSLTGSIPEGIGRLTSLQTLNLENNALDGIIPLSITDLSSLQELSLHNNQISGIIPFEISFLTNLEKLSLSSNQLQSSIPVAIRRLTSLKTLTLESNLLNGLLPTSMGSLTKLEILNLANNALTGTIPLTFWELSSLRTVVLANNSFIGMIPGLIENMNELRFLNLASNVFRGRIPESITSLTNLLVLDLSFNFFGGPIPGNIGNLTNLRQLLLGSNYNENHESFGLDGTIPLSIANMLDLERLELNRNRISGILPSRHGDLESIRVYDVSDNENLGGTIPGDFSRMAQLTGLAIFGTSIEGIVPDELCEGDISIVVDCDGATTINCRCCTCSE